MNKEDKVYIEIDGVKIEKKDRKEDIFKIMQEVQIQYNHLNYSLRDLEIPIRINIEWYPNENERLHLTQENIYYINDLIRIIKSKFCGVFSVFNKYTKLHFEKSC